MSVRTVLLVVVCVLALPAFAETPKVRDCSPGMDAPLVWKPTEEIAPPDVVTLAPGADASTAARIRIEVRALTDTREDPQHIGENPGYGNNPQCVFRVTTRDDPAAWTADRLRFLLRQLGYTVVESQGDVIISGELQKFFVFEDSVYKGDIWLKLDAVSKTGVPLWTGLVRGSNGHWGRTYKLANYQETVSDAIIDVVKHLLAEPTFTRILSSGTTEAPAKTP